MQNDDEGGRNAPACAACKHQRKKCKPENCVLWPHFRSDRMREFLAVHRVFGIANMSRMLRQLRSHEERHEATKSFTWEARAWAEDPVHGPFGQFNQLQRENQDLKTQLLQLRNNALQIFSLPPPQLPPPSPSSSGGTNNIHILPHSRTISRGQHQGQLRENHMTVNTNRSNPNSDQLRQYDLMMSNPMFRPYCLNNNKQTPIYRPNDPEPVPVLYHPPYNPISQRPDNHDFAGASFRRVSNKHDQDQLFVFPTNLPIMPPKGDEDDLAMYGSLPRINEV
ncbi:unnamed protein product [Cuscuta epithymum]|uniref:LOB domain-containing protein n=1 Tax=Cuscuta epithymum TaxID=186058 RepID=A0AAV0EHI5_9ASTE|nr:unnamed protein product [Cuscuta epithymum]